MKVLEADGIVQVIEGREVLAGLDLSLEQGEIPGLLGSKGSGKSTLLKILSGMQEPSADSSVYWEQFSAHPVLPYLARPNPAGQADLRRSLHGPVLSGRGRSSLSPSCSRSCSCWTLWWATCFHSPRCCLLCCL